MMFHPPRPSTLACLLAALAASRAEAQTFRGLGAAPGATGPVTVTGISGNGAVVFGNSSLDQAGYTWTAAAGGTWTPLVSPYHVGTLSASTTDGSVVIGTDYHTTLSDSHAAHWGTGIFDEFAPLPSHSRTRATGASADGTLIVGTSVGFNNLFSAATEWTDPNNPIDLGGYNPSAGDTAAALGISSDGTTPVGLISINHVQSAVRWTAVGTAQFLDNTTTSNATKASHDGSVVAGTVFFTDHHEAFRWTSAGMVSLGVLPGIPDTDPTAMSADGSVIVGNADSNPPTPFLWNAGGMQNLATLLISRGIDLTGWSLTGVTGISPDGNTLVGNGVHNGVTEPWLATLAHPCGSADFNCDGAIGTDADIESFFACLSGACPPPPCSSSADFNGDGAVGTDADIEAFFRVLAGGSC
jgi:uncharacterized membrane protein